MNVSIYSAGSTMRAAQNKVETVSNNMANISTPGYKAQRVMFEDLLYERMPQTEKVNLNGRVTSLGYQYGHGVKVNEVSNDMTTGSLMRTDYPGDVAIEGSGFFQLIVPNHVADLFGVHEDARANYGNEDHSFVFTRDGSFRIDVREGYSSLVDSRGYQVSDVYGNAVEFDRDVESYRINQEGYLFINGETTPQTQLMLANFRNPQSLHHAGKNIYVERNYMENNYLNNVENPEHFTKTKLAQGFIEGSNVDAVREMTNLIAAQRMLQLGARAVQSADTMLGLATSIRG